VKFRSARFRPARDSKKVSIRTSFFDLLQELSKKSHDDAWVIAELKKIFARHTVRLVRSMSPVALEIGTRRPGRAEPASGKRSQPGLA